MANGFKPGRAARLGAANTLAAFLLLLSSNALSAPLNGIYIDRTTLDSVVRSIPVADQSMGDKSLADRLARHGLRVWFLRVGKFTDDEMRLDPERMQRGDVNYRFTVKASRAVLHAACPMVASFNLTKRGQQWLVQDRTSNFLMRDECSVPM